MALTLATLTLGMGLTVTLEIALDEGQPAAETVTV
jgi:hypothetical protein